MYQQMKNELYGFYLQGDAERAKAFAEKCFAIMDSRFEEGMSVTAQKLLQYDVIAAEFTPVVFRYNPFFYETGVLTSRSDGARTAKPYGFVQANGWVYERNKHLFVDQDKELYARRTAQVKEQLYLICGPYNDVSQHFNYNNTPYLQLGCEGIYEKAKAQMPLAENEREKEFLQAVCHSMKLMKSVAEKFADKAAKMLEEETDPVCRKNLSLIAETARRVPWKKPETFYEALATLAFLRTVTGSLEGVGPNTFGRLDKDLWPFYKKDLESGRLTEEDAYKLICQFLLIWDCHYDHNAVMEGYADHELENTYTLGGCDEKGEPLYNEVTRLFLKASREENIIFPKIKCRFSKNSPKEYLDELNTAISKGMTTVLLQNDDATIAAVVRSGSTLEEARDYVVTGCWGLSTMQEKYDHGSYLNLLKPFEYAIHGLTDRIEKVGVDFVIFDGSESFEQLYAKVLGNCEKLLQAKLDVVRRGGRIHHHVDVLPIFSATLDNCVEKRADFTEKGGKYWHNHELMFGLPNIVDSLLAIKTLVFDKKICSLQTMLQAVRNNWEGYEDLRQQAIACPGWGDGSEESCQLANRFNNDLYEICCRQEGTYGGKVLMGHLTYTEIRFWGEKTLATPDGRYNGDCFSQGLTPSRLKKIPNVLDVIRSMQYLDGSTMGANSVVNLILPTNTPLDRLEGLLRAIGHTAMQSLQLNCVSKEDLLDAQKHPEKYPQLIVRVTGFSAKFTSLSPQWQEEVITRNFYD